LGVEWFIFVVMAVAFCGAVILFRVPVGVAIALGAVSGGLLGGLGARPLEFLRQLTEGEMAYFDPTLYILSATIFMVAIERSGLLGTVARWMLVTFHRSPALLLSAVTLLVIFPGMMTGSSTAAVLSTGALVTPVLMKIGIPRDKTGAIIAMIAIYGLCAPPVNIPALIICAGADVPFLGFALPLTLLSFPPAILCTLWLGHRYAKGVRLEDIESTLPESVHAQYGFKLYLPLILLAALLIGEHTISGLSHLGLPLIFLIAAASAPLTGHWSNPWSISQDALKRSIAILGILMAIGMFIQMMTFTGARGAITTTCAGMPRTQLYPIIGTSLPLFGAVSSYGAASVLGVPFVLSLLNKDVIITCAALSLCACLGDLTPPSAKAGLFAAAVVKEKNYLRILRHCILPAALTALFGVVVIIFANELKFLALYESDAYGVGEGQTEVIESQPQLLTASVMPSGEVSTSWLLPLISLFYRFYVGFLAVAVLVFLWRDTGRLTKINALMLLVPLILRFFLVV
jgi:TRAP-type C4-dicarboxylate transport system permease large subunit